MAGHGDALELTCRAAAGNDHQTCEDRIATEPDHGEVGLDAFDQGVE
jgi:hypothetical protein